VKSVTIAKIPNIVLKTVLNYQLYDLPKKEEEKIKAPVNHALLFDYVNVMH